MEIHTEGNSEADFFSQTMPDNSPAVLLKKSADSEGQTPGRTETTAETRSMDTGEDGEAIHHEVKPEEKAALEQQQKAFRKQLNREARKMVQGSIHEKVKLVVHRPEATLAHRQEYQEIASTLMPVIREMVQKTKPLLEHELSASFTKSSVYGSKFHAEKISSPDFRYFSKQSTPEEEPSLAVALRIDESASMTAFGRMEAAKQAAVAVYEFCGQCGIPLLLYGDTADRSPLEQMSLYAYIDWEEPTLNDKYALMTIQGHSNNRDGMALRILAEKLVRAPQKTKLLISISDGQPKAMPDYTGAGAVSDMKDVIREFSRKGVLFLAAAIGQDKQTICDIYGQERFMDITNLQQLPARLVQIIARYL